MCTVTDSLSGCPSLPWCPGQTCRSMTLPLDFCVAPNTTEMLGPHHHPPAYKTGCRVGTWKKSICFQEKDRDKSGESRSEHNFSLLQQFFHCNHNFSQYSNACYLPPFNTSSFWMKSFHKPLYIISQVNQKLIQIMTRKETLILLAMVGPLSGFPACTPKQTLTCHLSHWYPYMILNMSSQPREMVFILLPRCEWVLLWQLAGSLTYLLHPSHSDLFS